MTLQTDIELLSDYLSKLRNEKLEGKQFFKSQDCDRTLGYQQLPTMTSCQPNHSDADVTIVTTAVYAADL